MNHQDFRFGLIGVYNITSNILAKKDLLLAYVKNPYSIYLKAEQKWDSSSKNFSNLTNFDNLTLSTLWDRNSNNKNGL